jgi:deoxyribonuclease V
MKVMPQHSWQVSVPQARAIQMELAAGVSRTGALPTPRWIGGADISVPRAGAMATAAVVVLSYPELELVETRVINQALDFPYIPGLLSFREAPLVLAACERLEVIPDLMLVDGQGVAHPRRMGLASHLGLLLDAPTIGCAKSRLCGSHREPGAGAGDYTELVDKGEVIGAALRTKPGTNPLYVSIGHGLDLPTAMRWVLNCCRGYRIPEPLRLAHLAAGGHLPPEDYAATPGSRMAEDALSGG